MSNIVLSNGIRDTLLSLSNTKSQVTTTQSHLSTGLTVASAIDDAVKFFTSKTLNDRASDMSAKKDSIDQAVSSVTTASNALTSIEGLLKQFKGVLDSARSGSQSQRASYQTQLKNLSMQMQNLVGDASYNGLNLVNSTASTLTVYFSDKSASNLKVQGVNMNVSKLFYSSSNGAIAGISKASSIGKLLSKLGITASLSTYTLSKASVLAKFNSHVDTAQTYLDATIQNVRAQSATMGGNVAILQVRLDFTKNYVNTLQGGAGKLTVADLNSESANMVSLQTRQSLGVQAMSMANQSDQAVLQLFR